MNQLDEVFSSIIKW